MGRLEYPLSCVLNFSSVNYVEMTENIELLGIWNNVTLPKSPLGRIKPYGYNLKQPILGLSSLTSQPKSGRDTGETVKGDFGVSIHRN